jgi:hypothetical protein
LKKKTHLQKTKQPLRLTHIPIRDVRLAEGFGECDTLAESAVLDGGGEE